MKYPPHALGLRTDTEVSRPTLKRTPAEILVLRKRHETRKQAYVTAMVRERLLTAVEADRQYDDDHGRW